MALTKVTGQVINTSTDVTVGVLTVTNTLAVGGTVSIGGTLTYEDVTNIDSVGLITARNGIIVGSGITLSKDGDIFATGVTTATSFVGDGSQLTGVASTENIRTNTNATFLQNINVSGTSTIGGDVNIADKIVHIGDTNTAIRFPAADTVSFETGGSERMRLDNTGQLLLGHSGSSQLAGILAQVNIESVNSGNLTVKRNSANEFDATISLGKTRATSIGGATIVQENDRVGTIGFFASDGNDTGCSAAIIRAEVDGTPGSDDMPGRLLFMTTADGANGASERLRINSSGQVQIGNSASGFTTKLIAGTGSGDNGITVYSGTSNNAFLHFADGNSGSDRYRGYVNYSHSDNSMQFATNDTEALRIDSSGRLLLGTTTIGESNANNLTIAASGQSGITLRSGSSNDGAIFFSDATSGSGEYAGFVQYNHTNDKLNFGTSSTARAFVDSSGNFNISNGNLVIGTSGKGIDFSATGDASGASSELLDDYEEGTWTARFYPNSSAFGSSSYNLDNATYTRIGNVVHWAFRIRIASYSGGGGNLEISGLPYTVNNVVPQTTCHLHASNWADNSPKNIVYNAGGTRMALYYEAGTANSASPTNPVTLSALQANAYLIGQGFYFI